MGLRTHGVSACRTQPVLEAQGGPGEARPRHLSDLDALPRLQALRRPRLSLQDLPVAGGKLEGVEAVGLRRQALKA